MAIAPMPQAEDATRVDADRLFALRAVVRNMPERIMNPTGRPGGFAGKKRGNGLEIVDVRLFSDGDDARHIDAAATARTSKTHVRTFRDERDRAALLVADFRPAMLWGTRRRLRSVAAAGALALAGWRVVEAGGRVGLMAAGAGEMIHLPPRPRERAMAAVTAAMANAHEAATNRLIDGATDAPGLTEILESALARTFGGTTIYFATGLDDEGESFDRLAAAASRRFDLTVLLVRDRFETEAPPGAYPYRIIGNRAGDLGWAFMSRKREERQDERVERLRAAGVSVRIVPADREWTEIAAALEGMDGR